MRVPEVRPADDLLFRTIKQGDLQPSAGAV